MFVVVLTFMLAWGNEQLQHHVHKVRVECSNLCAKVIIKGGNLFEWVCGV